MSTLTPKGTWLHRDAPDAVDVSTWCLVVTGDPLLTRRARACEEYGHLVTAGPFGSPAPYGGFVRHGALAAQLGKGSPAAVRDAATRMHRLDAIDRAGIALAGSWVLAAEIINQHTVTPEAWDLGGWLSVTTGTPDADIVDRRQIMFASIASAGRKVTATDLEVWDLHAVTYGVDAVVLAIQSGYSVREITPAQLKDKATLAVTAALNAGSWS